MYHLYNNTGPSLVKRISLFRVDFFFHCVENKYGKQEIYVYLKAYTYFIAFQLWNLLTA